MVGDLGCFRPYQGFREHRAGMVADLVAAV